MLVAISAIPALAQLYYCGFSPPVDIPFGIRVEQAERLQTPIVWIDARPEDAFQMAHIPGALNLNRTNWDQALPRFFEAYAPGRSVIVYCSPDCTESEEIASRIRNLGLDQIRILEGGYEAWKEANPNL
jgi:rhodanese-related sulfurtransferase